MIAPVCCVACGTPSDDLCEACAPRVRTLAPPWCERCGTPLTPVTAPTNTHSCPACQHLTGFDRARSLVVFAEPARGLTLALKRKGRTELAAAIGRLLALLATREGLAGPSTTVTWVPGGKSARRTGFDHTALIARALARDLAVDAAGVLHRAHDGPRQADVPLDRRRSNVAGRFAAKRTQGGVLLVDDVFTTGATAEACATALKKAGATRVDVLTWARTPRLRRA